MAAFWHDEGCEFNCSYRASVPYYSYGGHSYNWGSYHEMAFGPKTTPGMIARQVKLFYDRQVRGIYYCGIGESWGLEGLGLPTFFGPNLHLLSVVDGL